MTMRYNYHRASIRGMPVFRLGFGKTFILAAASLLMSSAIGQEAATLTIDWTQVKAKVSPQLYGLMTEEINFSYDGGLYAEMGRNRTFQDRGFGGGAHWNIEHPGSSG